MQDCLDLLQRSPGHQSALHELSSARAQYCQRWYDTAAEDLESTWHSPIGQFYQHFIASDFPQRRILPTDWEFLQGFVKYCSGLPEPEASIRVTIVALAFPIQALNRAAWEDIRQRLPNWLRPYLEQALVKRSAILDGVGEALG
jgi:hypothetical protein